MKTKKLLFDVDDDDEALDIGLLRLTKNIPEHELFFHINRHHSLSFTRIADIVSYGTFYHRHFSCFETFYREGAVCLRCISNTAHRSDLQKESTELFSDECQDLLLPQYPDVDYILTASEPIDDFSVILQAEKFLFPIQEYSLSSDTELYTLIQYYE